VSVICESTRNSSRVDYNTSERERAQRRSVRPYGCEW
jgi:hypothetical protein